MKRFISLGLAVVFCIACEKEKGLEEIPEPSPMQESDLIGTYWTQTRYICSGGPNGEDYYVDSDKNPVEEALHVDWYIVSRGLVVIHYETDEAPYHSYKCVMFQVDLYRKKLNLRGSWYDLLEFSAEQIVYTGVQPDGMEYTCYFRPFTPSEELREAMERESTYDYEK